MGNIYFSKGGIAPTGGMAQVLYTDPSLYRDGARRIKSSRQNALFDVVFTTIGDTVPDLTVAERMVALYETRAKLYWEQNIGEKPSFRYRVADGLRHLPDPLIGEWAEYWVIKEVKTRRPSSWADLRPAGISEKVIAQLVCEPTGRGNPQVAGRAGTFYQDQLGRFWLCANKNNVLKNPSFSHPTNRIYGWNLTEYLTSSAVVYYMDTDDYFSGDASLVLVTDSSKPVFDLYQSSVTLSGVAGAGYIIKRIDGGEVDSGVVQVTIDGLTPTQVHYRPIPDTDWWMVMTAVTGATSGYARLKVQPGQAIKVDYAWYGTVTDADELHGFLPLDSDTPGSWPNVVGNAAYEAAAVIGSASFLTYSVPYADFLKDFTLSFHATILGKAGPGQTVADTDFIQGASWAFNYASLNMYLRYNGTTSRWEYRRFLDGVWHVATSSQTTIVWGSKLHIIITEIGNTARVYIDGIEVVTLSNLPQDNSTGGIPFLDNQEFSCLGDGGFSWAIDGLKFFPTGLSQAEVTTLTGNEAVEGQVQAPLYFSTMESLGYLRLGYDIGETGYIYTSNGVMIGNVPGTEAAEYEIKLLPGNSPDKLYLYGIAVSAPPSFSQLRAFTEKFAASSDDPSFSMSRYSSVFTTSRQRYYPAYYDWMNRFRKNVKGEFQVILTGEVGASFTNGNYTIETLVSQNTKATGDFSVNNSYYAQRQGKTATGDPRKGTFLLAEIGLLEDRRADNQRVALEVIAENGLPAVGTYDTLFLVPLDNIAKLAYQNDESQGKLSFDGYITSTFFHLTPDNCWIKTRINWGHPSNYRIFNQFRYEYEIGQQPRIWPGMVNFLCVLADPNDGLVYPYTNSMFVFDFIVTPRYI